MRWIAGIIGLVAIVVIVALAIGPGIVERGQNQLRPDLAPATVSAAGQQLHQRLRLADLHSDTFLWHRNVLKRANRGHVDVPRLQAGGVAVQVFSAVTKSPAGQNYEANDASSDTITALVVAQQWPVKTWNSLLERALYQAQRAQEAAQSPELTLIRSRGALADFLARWDEAAAPRPVAAVLATEGAHPLEGDLDNLEQLWSAGYRMLGLHHFFDNRLGGSLHGLEKGGLTAFGKAVVDAAEQRGFIIDVAHSSAQSVSDVLDRVTRPVVISHTGIAGACATPRNIPNALMQRIASGGGLVGIGYWDAAVCDFTPAGVARTIAYAVRLLGDQAVALGSDYDGATTVAFDTSRLAVLVDALLAEGLSETQIAAVMGENQLRFLTRWLPEADQ